MSQYMSAPGHGRQDADFGAVRNRRVTAHDLLVDYQAEHLARRQRQRPVLAAAAQHVQQGGGGAAVPGQRFRAAAQRVLEDTKIQ
ncbi:hypothetical protein D3C84_1246850 [compost metagenome]